MVKAKVVWVRIFVKLTINIVIQCHWFSCAQTFFAIFTMKNSCFIRIVIPLSDLSSSVLTVKFAQNYSVMSEEPIISNSPDSFFPWQVVIFNVWSSVSWSGVVSWRERGAQNRLYFTSCFRIWFQYPENGHGNRRPQYLHTNGQSKLYCLFIRRGFCRHAILGGFSLYYLKWNEISSDGGLLIVLEARSFSYGTRAGWGVFPLSFGENIKT